MPPDGTVSGIEYVKCKAGTKAASLAFLLKQAAVLDAKSSPKLACRKTWLLRNFPTDGDHSQLMLLGKAEPD